MSPSNAATNNDNDALTCPMEQNGKYVRPVSWSSFLATSALLPVCAVTVLPISVLYQLGKTVVQVPFGSKNKKNEQQQHFQRLDSGYIVDESRQVIPREKRKYDMVVLGVTGFTGRLAARYLAKTYGVDRDIKWAIAGRSKDKLDAVKTSLAKELDMNKILDLETIVVDTSVPATLPKLVEQTRVVATTVGPYGLYGSSVVEFCAKFGTHYVDITGEVDWVQNMIHVWQRTAQRTGAKLIPFCGHDSVPWDLSVIKLQEILQQECQDDLKSVTFWDEARAEAPGGTYQTVMSFVTGMNLPPPNSDFDPFLKLPDGSKSVFKAKADLPIFIAPSQTPFPTKGSPWTIPFVMAPVNAKVARWTHALRSTGSRALTYREFMQLPDFKSAFTSYGGMLIIGSLLLNPLTASLLKHYVFPKSGEGPAMSAMEEKNFLCIKGEGVGVKGNHAECVMYFDKDPGCLETARMMVEAGLCLALEDDKLPSKSQGGFWSPAAGLGDVLLDRLTTTGTHFASRVVPSIHSKL